MKRTGLQRANIPAVWPFALIAAAVRAVYANGRDGDFVCDDRPTAEDQEPGAARMTISCEKVLGP
jgi:hypothetical protein